MKQYFPGNAKRLIHFTEDASTIPESSSQKRPPEFGSARQYLIQMADDFDEPLEDFAEYIL